MNSLYQSYQESKKIPDPPQNLNGMLMNFSQTVLSKAFPGMNDPEQMVRSLIQSGRMKPEQFDQLAQVANKWTGNNRR